MCHIRIKSIILLLTFTITAGGCSIAVNQAAQKLQLQEHQLMRAPEPAPLQFQPLDGSQEQILAANAGQRAKDIYNEIVTIDGSPAMHSMGETNDLVAILLTDPQDHMKQFVQLKRNNETIFEAPAGLPSPGMPLQALWTYDNHWALEILYADLGTFAGRLYIDGESINDKKGYEDAFGLQLLSGKLFYFYQKGDVIGYAYGDKEHDLNYNEIPHYHCCAESLLNPIQAEDMVAFFARRDTDWYYVELGAFDR